MKYVFIQKDTCKPDKIYSDTASFCRDKSLSPRIVNKLIASFGSYATEEGVLWKVEHVKNERMKRKGRPL